MASTEYDQYENEYKPVESAKQVEEARDRAMNEGAEEMRKAEYEKHERAFREQEESRAIEKARDDAMAEGVREIKRRKESRRQQFREDRESVREERQQKERAESAKIEKARDDAMAEGAREYQAVVTPARNKAIGNVNEAMGGLFGKQIGENVTRAQRKREGEEAHKGLLSGLRFDASEKLQQVREGAKIRRQQTAEFMQHPGQSIMRGADALALKGYQSAKVHGRNMLADMMQPVPKKKSQKQPAIASYGVGGLVGATKGMGSGLLSSLSFMRPTSNFLLFGKAPVKKTTRRKRQARAPQPVARKRDFLDDLLF